jgi:hypothetical protein
MDIGFGIGDFYDLANSDYIGFDGIFAGFFGRSKVSD